MVYTLLLTKTGDKEAVQIIETEENERYFFYLDRQGTESKGMLRGTQMQ
jgi:hypothetical protein